MTTATITRPRATSRRSVLTAIALVAGIAVFIGLGTVALRSPEVVDEVRIVNDTSYDIHVGVSGSDGRSLGLGNAPRKDLLTVQSVLDQGERWTFTFSYAGEQAAELSLTSAELERAGWTVAVPAEAGDRLETAGFPPPRGATP
jgi:hypothetical protein